MTGKYCQNLKPCDDEDARYLHLHVPHLDLPRPWKLMSPFTNIEELSDKRLLIEKIQNSLQKEFVGYVEAAYFLDQKQRLLSLVLPYLEPRIQATVSSDSSYLAQAEEEWTKKKAAEEAAEKARWITARIAHLKAQEVAKNAEHEEAKDNRLIAEAEARKLARRTALELVASAAHRKAQEVAKNAEQGDANDNRLIAEAEAQKLARRAALELVASAPPLYPVIDTTTAGETAAT